MYTKVKINFTKIKLKDKVKIQANWKEQLIGVCQKQNEANKLKQSISSEKIKVRKLLLNSITIQQLKQTINFQCYMKVCIKIKNKT